MIQESVKDKFDTLRGLGTDDVLAALGLERRRTALDILIPAAGMFAAGMVVGAGVAFLIAPKSGRETRRQLKDKATNLSQRLTSSAESLAHDVRDNVFGSDESRSNRSPDNGGTSERKGNEPPHRAMPPPNGPAHSGPQK